MWDFLCINFIYAHELSVIDGRFQAFPRTGKGDRGSGGWGVAERLYRFNKSGKSFVFGRIWNPPLRWFVYWFDQISSKRNGRAALGTFPTGFVHRLIILIHADLISTNYCMVIACREMPNEQSECGFSVYKRIRLYFKSSEQFVCGRIWNPPLRG